MIWMLTGALLYVASFINLVDYKMLGNSTYLLIAIVYATAATLVLFAARPRAL